MIDQSRPDDLTQRVIEELHEKARLPWTLNLEVLMVYQLASQLQLALRHPANHGPSAEASRFFLGTLAKAFSQFAPAIGESIALGNEPANDVPVDPPAAGPSFLEVVFDRFDAAVAGNLEAGALHVPTTLVILAQLREVVSRLDPRLGDRLVAVRCEAVAAEKGGRA